MKKFRRTIAIALPVFAIYGFFLFLRASDDPKFCASCHYMEQYYNNWLNSSHNQVSCVKCHYAPGAGNYIKGKIRLASEILRYYIGAYSAEVTSKINDGACLQCHKKQDFFSKDITFDKGKITFNHADHFNSSRVNFTFKCQTCHAELVQGQHGGVSTRICILCHFAGSDMRGGPVGGCGVCHGPPKNEIYVWNTPFNHSKYLKSGVNCQTCHLHVTAGTGSVTRDKCLECHVSVPDTFPDMKSMHEEHVTKDDIKCSKCHGVITHGKIQMYDVFTPDCQQCHGNRHSIQEQVYSGSGGKNIPVIPDPMFLADVTCEGCHSSMGPGIAGVAATGMSDVAMTGRMPAASLCSTCHGEAFDKLLGMWQGNVKSRMQELEAEKWKNFLFSGKMDSANSDIELVKKDGSLGAHNNRYVNLLLDEAAKELKVVSKKPDVETLYERNSACLSCHFGIENVKVEVKDQTFPHGPHLFSQRCVNCHVDTSPSSPEHGKLTAKGGSCSDCHHQAKNPKCETCHPQQAGFYAGTFLAASPDSMSSSGIACSDCHLAAGNYPSIPTADVCASCHDAGTMKALQAEQTEVKTAISEWDRMFPKMVASYGTDLKGAGVDSLRAIERDVENFKKEGSYGAHNSPYAKLLVRRIGNFLGNFKY